MCFWRILLIVFCADKSTNLVTKRLRQLNRSSQQVSPQTNLPVPLVRGHHLYIKHDVGGDLMMMILMLILMMMMMMMMIGNYSYLPWTRYPQLYHEPLTSPEECDETLDS